MGKSQSNSMSGNCSSRLRTLGNSVENFGRAKEARNWQRQQKKKILAMKRKLPAYIQLCKSASISNHKAAAAMRKAAARGRTGAYNKAKKRLNQTFRKGCNAQRKAYEVWNAYRKSGDNIGAKLAIIG